MVLIDNNGDKWVDLGGYEADEHENIICYWCIPLEHLPYYEAEYSTFTKILVEDLIQERTQRYQENKMKEYLTKNSKGEYQLINHHFGYDDIEVPEGADEYRSNLRFYKNNGKLFYVTYGEWEESGLRKYETLWKRNPTTHDTSIQHKLKFIEKCLNGEKIQYILGEETDKSQWYNLTEGAMQYIKRSDIKFREAPKYVTINGVEFKSVESLLKYVKNNFDLEDGQ